MYLLSIITILVALISIVIADPVPRIVGGQDVDHLRQFPHHVYIICSSYRKCGGSILNDHWVLTSAACVMNSLRLELHFGMKNEYDFGSAYHTISVNSEQVYPYPTNYDDLALIRLPMQLVFSDTVRPVVISGMSTQGVHKKFAVLPGFGDPLIRTVDGPYNPNDDTLKYGMFSIADTKACKQRLDGYDEYSQICTEGWGSNPSTPCDSDFGSGLVIGWPAKSELVGVFSMYSPSCDVKAPAVYTFVPKYISWISSMIKG